MPNIISIPGGGGSSSWFANVPDGNWVLKSTANSDQWPGFSNNVIPLCGTFSTSYSGHSNNCTSGNMSGNKSATQNGKTALSVSGSMNFAISRGEANISGSGKAYNVFLPAFYDFDLTATQEGVTSGTITAWLVRE